MSEHSWLYLDIPAAHSLYLLVFITLSLSLLFEEPQLLFLYLYLQADHLFVFASSTKFHYLFSCFVICLFTICHFEINVLNVTKNVLYWVFKPGLIRGTSCDFYYGAQEFDHLTNCIWPTWIWYLQKICFIYRFCRMRYVMLIFNRNVVLEIWLYKNRQKYRRLAKKILFP